MAAPIVPVILAGGSGIRLWPLSRQARPKTLLAPAGGRSMLVETVLRLGGNFAAPWVICAAEHGALTAAALAKAGIRPARIIVEPMGRNTGPAIAAAAMAVAESMPEAVIAVLPADHWVAPGPEFAAAMARATAAAAAGHLVIFGIRPRAAETGYGYIEVGGAVSGLDGIRRVAAFVEKPPVERARDFLEGGRHRWNSGMVVAPAAVVIAELERWAPAVLDAARQALATAERGADFLRLAAEPFSRAPKIAFDRAVLERTSAAVMVEAGFGWSDLGAWPALRRAAQPDGAGNVVTGAAVILDTANSQLRTDQGVIATIGLDGFIVVRDGDVVLVLPEARAAELPQLIEAVRKQRPDLL